MSVNELKPFQSRVHPWMLECFGAEIAADKLERSDRAVEEMLELSQAVCALIGVDFAPRAHALVDYVAGRPIGEPRQEVGGVMVTLAALCLAVDLDMHEAGEAELARINRPETVLKIRAKQAAKPTGSALPQAVTRTPPELPRDVVAAEAKHIDAIRLAYGLLWHMYIDQRDPNLKLAVDARAALLSVMTQHDQIQGIDAAKMTDGKFTGAA